MADDWGDACSDEWRERYNQVRDLLHAARRTNRVDEALAKQLSRAMALNARYATALQRIRSLDQKNVEKYAQEIAIEALKS